MSTAAGVSLSRLMNPIPTSFAFARSFAASSSSRRRCAAASFQLFSPSSSPFSCKTVASANSLSTLSSASLKKLVTAQIWRRNLAIVSDATKDEISSSGTASQPSPLQNALAATQSRNDWAKEEIKSIYNTPLMELTYAAATVHRRFHNPSSIQMCTLLNIKTGGCSEDCSYCAQSTRYSTGIVPSKLVTVESVLSAARIAKENGSTRFCMGAAWRDMRGRKTNLKRIKEMVSGVRELGMECCVTLGMIDEEQAKELKSAGLTAYNHNVDTSREFYPNVITTRSYDERLDTIDNVRKAGISVCSGGILGLGEAGQDRVSMLYTLATMPSHPESLPINALVPIKGTPLGDTEKIPFVDVLRTIATARLVLPEAIIRLAAGRISMSEEQQVMCFSAGANAVFTGEKMLTTECSGWEEDKEMFGRWGLRPMESFERKGAKERSEREMDLTSSANNVGQVVDEGKVEKGEEEVRV